MRKSFMSVVFAALACCGFVFNAQARTFTFNANNANNNLAAFLSGTRNCNTSGGTGNTTYALADGDIVQISADITQKANYVVSKKNVTIQSSGTTVRTFTRTTGTEFEVKGTVTFKNIKIAGATDASSNSGIWIHESGASVTLDSGAVLDGFTGAGGNSAAVYVGSGATLTLNSGSTISNCKQNDTSNGGAVYVGGGTVNIAGGTISGCSTTGKGGAIYNAAGTITMTAGTVTGCSANGGGAIDQEGNGTTTISGGTIRNCTSGTSSSGGAARIAGGTFSVTGGTFTGNKSTSNYGGGAFFLNSGTLNVSGGTITGNTINSGKQGGGIYYSSGTLNFSGSPVITGNKTTAGVENNVGNVNPANVKQSGNLTSSAKIGISYPTSGTVEGTQFATRANTSYTGAETAFSYDGDSSYVAAANGTTLAWHKPNYVCQIGTKKYEDALQAMNDIQDGQTLTLLVDFPIPFDLPITKSITLDGNGHTLTRTAANAEITVAANVTLKNVVVDGGNLAAQDAMFVVAPTGALTVQNGTTIRNCKNTTGNGGAIRANGPVNLQGGTIMNCSAKEGGAVYVAEDASGYAYYRFTFKGVTESTGIFQLSEISLYDAKGARFNTGLAFAANNTAAANLAAGSAAFIAPANNTTATANGNNGSESVEKLFDGNTGTKLCTNNNPGDGTNPEDWFSVVFRLPTAQDLPATYSFTTANDATPARNPRGWVVEASKDGQNWITLDSHDDGMTVLPTATETESTKFAVEAAAARVTVSGAATVADNKATDGALSNVQLQSADQLALGGDFTGSVGVSYPAADPDGSVFGAAGSYAGADKFFYDGDATLTGVKEGATLAWPVRAVAQIGSTKYQTLAEAVAAAKDGDTIELLTNLALDADVTINKNVTLTSVAGKNYKLTRAADAQINVTAGALTLTNLTLDGAEMAATKPLVNVAAGAALNLTNGAKVTGATAGGIAAAGTVNVSGNPVVTGNTAAGQASDLAPASANVLNLVGDFTGSIGVRWPQIEVSEALSGRPFGAATTFAGAENFFFDGSARIKGTVADDSNRLVWPEVTEKEIDVGGDSVVYDGASSATVLPDGDLVLVFDDPSKANTFTLPKNAKARILLVGGGGAGGSIGIDVNGAAGGGGAGGFIDRLQTLDPGTYTVQIGAGGKRVQTVVQSWVGDDGDYSCIKLGDEIVALAKGGGGGGTVKIGGNGTEGGSGGGGAWYGKALAGGLGTEGQGRAGGTPQDQDYGGGGGGAAMAGGVNGTAGTGKTSDITGDVVTYAQGGRGGDKTDAAYEAKAGAGAGFGGDGAVKGFGGAGADGLVIVRIHKLFDYVRVPYPEYVDDFTWESGKTRTAFDLNAQSAEFKAAIAEMKGTNSVTCTGTDDDMEGLGRYNFVLYLNDGYMWEDGSLDPFGATWRIKDPDTIGKASIDVKKTVSWTDGPDATISIDVHSTPEAKKTTPKVLMVGTACNAHGFDQSVLTAALNAAAKHADVHYAFYNTVSSTTGVTPAFEGDLTVGETFNKSVSMSEGQHGGLYGFYTTLSAAVNSGTQYDYVIFVFDRSLVGTYFPGTHPNEAAVAAWLKPFYDRNAVIWLVDKSESADKTPVVEQFPWFPSQYLYAHFTSGSSTDRWTSLYQWEYSWGNIAKGDADGSKAASFKALRAMLGLFDPTKYMKESQNWSAFQTSYNNNIVSGNNPTDTTKIQATAGSAIQNQVIYDNAKNVADIIAEVIKPVIHTIGLNDNVCVSMGLDVKSSHGKWTTNEVAMGWKDLTSSELKNTETGVTIELPNIQDEAWIHLDIAVEDTGLFKSSINATYNERTGLWEKDPNDGPVTVQLTPKGGTKIVAQDQAKTEVAWSYEAYKITGEVVHGEGEFIINGFIVDEESGIDFKNDGIALSKGYSPEVVFRGKPGWILDYLEIDGVQEPFTMETYNKIFVNIGENHDVKVGFKNILVENPYPETAPYVHLYDGDAYGCLITSEPNFTDDLTFPWWPVYSLESNGVYTTDGGQIEVLRDAEGNVIPNDVYVRIAIKQPGYEEPVVIDNWTGVNKVTILPRDVTIQIEDQFQTSSTRIPKSNFTFHELTDALKPGDRIVVTNSDGFEINYPDKGSNAPISDANADAFKIVDADGNDVTGNYNITVNPGTYYYPKADQVMANAPDVIKYYDGQATDIDVTVTNPTRAPTDDEIKSMKGGKSQYNNIRDGVETKKTLYSLDGVNWSETEPTFTDVGEYTVHYKVTYLYDFEYSQYTGRWADWKSDSIEYESFESSAKVIIKPREVVVTAGSAEKLYDGTALTEAGYTVTPRDDANGKGFAAGEGFASLNMTAGSTITDPGTVANTPDAASATFTANTDLKNYNITYVDGSLTVTQNPLRASASDNEKVYDGEPITWSGVAVTDSTGKPLASGYTIYYKTEPDGPWTTTVPELPTDAGDYPIFWRVDGGAGRGVVEGESVLSITPRTVTLVAGSAEQDYTGEPLTCTDFTVKEGSGEDYGFINGDGVTAVVMTKDSTITDPGKTANKIDTGAIDQWTFLGDTKAQNYTFLVEDGTLKVNWVKEIRVTGPGTLSWKEQITAPADAKDDEVFLTITIDGGDPIEVSKGNMNDPKLETLIFGGETNIEHVVTFTYTNDYGPQAKCTVTDEKWVPYSIDIAPALKDDPSAADFVITNLGTEPTQFNEGTTRHNGEKLVTVGLLDENGVQTNDVVNTTSDAGTKGTEDYWYVVPDPRGGENTVAMTAPTLETNEVVTLTVTVTGDGEFSWDSLLQTTEGEGKHPANITVIVDGKTNQVYGAEEDWTKHTIHVTDEPGKDGAEHLIEIIYTQDGDDASSVGYLDNLTWKPSATREQMYEIVDNDPPLSAEEEQKYITVVNGPESGWMPVKDEDGNITGVRSPDGTEGTSTTNDLDSVFKIGVVGSGEIKIDTITIPVKNPEDSTRNPDGGLLTITVDDKVFEIPPVPDESVSYTITTNGNTIVIENLIIKVTGEPTTPHTVVFEYTRDADDPTGNTAAVIDHITWKSYGEREEGGSSWLQGKALWIIDHEDPGDGWVYLAFEPELKVEEELNAWVHRSDENDMIKVKYGETREEADACKPVIAHLSDKPGHEVKPVKVWIKVSLKDMNEVTVVKPVGFWRIFIDGPAIRLSETEGHEDETVDQPKKAASLMGVTPPLASDSPAREEDIVGEGAVSINTFGILKIERATTNSMIAVPWTWYSKFQNDAENIPVKKLVKTTNLEEGDYLYAPLDNDTYAAWTVECESVTDARGNVYTNSKWSAAQVVRVDQDGFGRMQFRSDDDEDDETYTNSTRIARGNGLWLHRQKPLDAEGNIRPFWVYGQSVTTEVTTVISGPTGSETVHSTMIGNPYARDLVLNEINFEGTIDSGDRIKIHTLEGADHDLVYVKGKGWREYVTKIVNGVKKSGYTYQTVIPAGMAFWYDRRGATPLTITWPKPQE